MNKFAYRGRDMGGDWQLQQDPKMISDIVISVLRLIMTNYTLKYQKSRARAPTASIGFPRRIKECIATTQPAECLMYNNFIHGNGTSFCYVGKEEPLQRNQTRLSQGPQLSTWCTTLDASHSLYDVGTCQGMTGMLAVASLLLRSLAPPSAACPAHTTQTAPYVPLRTQHWRTWTAPAELTWIFLMKSHHLHGAPHLANNSRSSTMPSAGSSWPPLWTCL